MPDATKGIVTDLSYLARPNQQVKPTITPVPAGNQSASIDNTPFGPMQPLTPLYPEQSGRRFDYQVGYNIITVPRAEEPISFAQLRAVSRNLDMLRLVIEQAKDEVCKVRFNFVPIDKKQKPDSRCDMLTKFFRFPDRVHDWKTWIRMILEDMLSIDAVAIEPRFTNGGGVYGFDVIDGATIRPKIDGMGRIPAPPDVAYQQYIKGVQWANYSIDTLIYMPRNLFSDRVYGFSPVEQIITIINIAMRRQVHQLQYYTEGSTPDLLMSVPDSWTPSQISQFQQSWDALLAGDTAARRHAKFIPHGIAPYDPKQNAIKDEYDEWLARIISYAFNVSNTWAIKQMNRSTAQTHSEETKEVGVRNRIDWVCDLVNYIIVKYFQIDDICIRPEEATDIDPMIQAQIDQIYLTDNGQGAVISPEEVRERLGLEGPAPEKITPIPSAVVGNNSEEKAGVAVVEKVERVKKKAYTTDRTRPFLKKAEKKATAIMTKHLAVAAVEVAGQIVDEYSKLSRTDETPESEIEGIIEKANIGGKEKLRDSMGKVIESVFLDGGNSFLLDLGVKDNEKITTQINALAKRYARERGAELVGMRWDEAAGEFIVNPNPEWSIDEGTRTMIRSEVKQAIAEGWSNDKLRKEIEDNQAFSKTRAKMIARTETSFAESNGNYEAALMSGVVTGKESSLNLSHDDGLKCDCVENSEAGVIGVSEEFPSGDLAAPYHPNCECVTVYYAE